MPTYVERLLFSTCSVTINGLLIPSPFVMCVYTCRRARAWNYTAGVEKKQRNSFFFFYKMRKTSEYKKTRKQERKRKGGKKDTGHAEH